jgi:hypothetical protein
MVGLHSRYRFNVVLWIDEAKDKDKTYKCRCNGRLQNKRFTRISYTGLVVELEHRKIKTGEETRGCSGGPIVMFIWIGECVCLLWIDERTANIKPIYECRCNERLQTKRFTSLSYTFLVVEHLKIKTRLTTRVCEYYYRSLLWIDKARVKDKRYKEVSVWWKTTN